MTSSPLPLRLPLALALWLGACRVGAPAPMSTPPASVERPPLVDTRPLAARCDPNRCENFCAASSCLFGDLRACLTVCRERCGDAYFEPADHELVDCVESQAGCEGAKTCCAQHFTSHLCAD